MSDIKRTHLKDLYSKSYKNEKWDFKHKITLDLVNFSWEYENKDKEKQSFSSNAIKITKSKLDFKTWEVKHKALIGRDWNPFSKPDSNDFYIWIDEFNDIISSSDWILELIDEL